MLFGLCLLLFWSGKEIHVRQWVGPFLYMDLLFLDELSIEEHPKIFST